MIQVIKKALDVPVTTNVLFVDLNGVSLAPDGSIGKPYTTIQAALDTIPVPPTPSVPPVGSPDDRKVYSIIIAPGTYDEDIAIDITRKKIILTSWGPWNLGTFDANDWAPTLPRRNIVITNDGTGVNDNIREGFSIQPMLPYGEGLTTHESYMTRPRISGAIDVSGRSGGSLELILSCEIFGTNGGTTGNSIISGASIVQSYIYDSRFRGQIPNNNNWNFQMAENSRFQGLVDVGVYSTITLCKFDNGMTVFSATKGAIQPDGFYNTDLRGTFTGPVGSLRLDAGTNYWFTAAGGVLAGGATKVYMNNALGSGYTPTTPAEWAGSPLTTQEAIDRLAATVFLLNGSVPIP